MNQVVNIIPSIPASDLSLLFSVFLTSFICKDDFVLKLILPLKLNPFIWSKMHAQKAHNLMIVNMPSFSLPFFFLVLWNQWVQFRQVFSDIYKTFRTSWKTGNRKWMVRNGNLELGTQNLEQLGIPWAHYILGYHPSLLWLDWWKETFPRKMCHKMSLSKILPSTGIETVNILPQILEVNRYCIYQPSFKYCLIGSILVRGRAP